MYRNQINTEAKDVKFTAHKYDLLHEIYWQPIFMFKSKTAPLSHTVNSKYTWDYRLCSEQSLHRVAIRLKLFVDKSSCFLKRSFAFRASRLPDLRKNDHT
jgi:hypothetical protein